MRYRILVTRLSKVFIPGSELDAKLARVVVLYEDLRIENLGLTGTLPALDESGADLRRLYFVRRSIATLREFAEALTMVDACASFAIVRERFDAKSEAQWTKSITFFGRWERYLRDVRNDFGGHFGYKAALFAINNLHDGAAAIEYAVDQVRNTGNMRLKFAAQIVTVSMRRHARADGVAAHFRFIFRLVLAAFGHATRCTQILVRYDLWARFRG